MTGMGNMCPTNLGGKPNVASAPGQTSGGGGGNGGNTGSGNSGGVMNNMDYMQQQNHIFVFSTQLANKGAESVLSGQFPTIIAYHCAQPNTKKFLEDFFLKNPMKLSKMNRQNASGNSWMMNSNHSSVMAKMAAQQQHPNKGGGGGGAGNNNNNNSNAMMGQNTSGGGNSGPGNNQPAVSAASGQQGGRMGTKPSPQTPFGGPDDLPGADAELLPWEQGGLEALANGGNAGSGGGDISLDDNLVADSPSLGAQRSCNKSAPNSMQQNPGSPGDGLQPSLQGVKVPDENLTPQQRQHRDEQLAKLKKISDQFLFPEHTHPDFVAQMAGVGADQPPGPGGPGPGGKMMAGNPGGMSPNMGGLRGSNMMGGMGPRNAMCRPTGMGSMVMSPDNMMGGGGNGPPAMNDMGGMPCGMMMGNQPMPGNGPMMGGGPMGHQMPGGPMNPCGMGNSGSGMMMGQKPHMGMGPGPGQGGMAQMEWSKLQHQFYEERKGKGMDGMGGNMCPSNMPGGRQMPPGGMRPNSHQGGPRSQGPPPPYHQTPRSASVPIATQSPNPGSPNNPTSNLSLPSPRTGSTLNSPAGDGVPSGSCNAATGGKPYKQDSPANAGGLNPNGSNNNNTSRTSLSHNSNPGTPISHMSPNASLKDLELGPLGGNPTANGNQSNDNPNLMPVPSPQQIHYLSAFDGQELTIQKQPNNLNCKDGSHLPSPVGGDGRFGKAPGGNASNSTFPLHSIPPSSQNPNAIGTSCDKNQRLNTSAGPSPQGSRTPSMGDQNNQSNIDSRFPPASPGMNFSPVTGGQGGNQPGNPGNGGNGANKMGGGFMDVAVSGKGPTSTNETSSGGGNFCVRADNLPLNPNSSCPPPAKTSHFDPISSLAQMSQQLTSSVASSLNGQPGGGPSGNVGPMGVFPNHGGGGMGGMPGDMQMGGPPMDGMMGPGGMDACGGMSGPMSHGMGVPGQYGMHGGNPGGPMGMMGGPGPRSLSPKLGGGMMGFPGGPGGMGMPPHRMMGRPGMGGPYNGANIQVKASTPNTIQYLPARPQMNNTNPRVPPSLEFLQRFASPQMPGMDGGPGGPNGPNKMQQNQQAMGFYGNCNQMGGQGGPMGGMNPHMDGGMGPDGMMGMGGPMGGMAQQNMMMRGLRPPGQGMMRMQGPPGHMGVGPNQHHHPFSNGPPSGPGPNGPGGPNDPSMFPGNQMFAQGPKGSPMNPNGGPNGPDGGQPLPPSMVGPNQPGGNFKSSQFVGPSTADPNYAQQYHNFQQQLYATSTRSQMNNQPTGPCGNNGPPGNAGPMSSHLGPNPNQQFFVPK